MHKAFYTEITKDSANPYVDITVPMPEIDWKYKAVDSSDFHNYFVRRHSLWGKLDGAMLEAVASVLSTHQIEMGKLGLNLNYRIYLGIPSHG